MCHVTKDFYTQRICVTFHCFLAIIVSNIKRTSTSQELILKILNLLTLRACFC